MGPFTTIASMMRQLPLRAAPLVVLLEDPFGQIAKFIRDVQTALLGIAGTFAVIGILGLGMMYVGSSLPLISEWKQNNPKAFRDVTWGLIFLIIASGGGIAALIGTGK